MNKPCLFAVYRGLNPPVIWGSQQAKDPYLDCLRIFLLCTMGFITIKPPFGMIFWNFFPSISCKCKPIRMSLVGFEDRLGDLRFALRLFWVPIPWSFGPQWRSRVVTRGQDPQKIHLPSPVDSGGNRYCFRECNRGSVKIPTVSGVCHTWCKLMVRLGDLCVSWLLFVLEKWFLFENMLARQP